MSSHRGNPGLSSAKNSHRTSLISRFYEKDKMTGNKKKNTNTPNGKRQNGNNNNIHNNNIHNNNNNNNKPVNLLPEMDRVRGIGVGAEDATPQELYAIGAVFDHLYRGGSPMNCISVFRKEVNRAPSANTFGCNFGFGGGADGDETLAKTGSAADDDTLTLQTNDWTYNRSSLGDDADTLYTLDEDGTYARSFVSRQDSLQSNTMDGERARAVRFANARSRDKFEQPWDEGTVTDTVGGMIGAPPRHRRKNSNSSQLLFNEINGISRSGSKNKRGKGRQQRNSRDDSSKTPSSEQQQQIQDVPLSDEGEETMERLMMWSEVLVASARENGPKAVAAAGKAASAAAAAAAGARRTDTNPGDDDESESNSSIPVLPSVSCAGSDLTSLVHMFRTTVAEGIPEEARASTSALQTTLVRTFPTYLGSFVQNYEMQEDENDDLYSRSDSDSYDSRSVESPPKPLNSLAKAMQRIAKKEPSRTYAASEQDQVVSGTAPTQAQAIQSPSNQQQQQQQQQKQSSPSHRSTHRSSASSVGATIESNDTPPPRGAQTSPFRLPFKRQSNAFGGSSVTGSHRGDAASVSTPVRGSKVPASIRLPPSTSETAAAFQELFISPTRVTSGVSIPRPRSFFRRRGSADGPLPDATYKNESSTQVSKASYSPRRHLPPVPPTRSPMRPPTASPPRNLHLISDNDGTELSIIGYPEGTDTSTVGTPPRSPEAATSSSSSPKSSSGISIKAILSFRKRKPDNSGSSKDNDVAKYSTNAVSPRSTIGVDSQIFQSATENTSTYYDESDIACIADDSIDGNSIVATPLNYENNNNNNNNNETSTINGLLMAECNGEEYEVQSV